MDIMKVVTGMSAGALGGIIVGAFVTAGNYSGISGTIAGLFTFILLASVALFALRSGYGGK